MPQRKPLVIVDGQVQQLVTGDTISGSPAVAPAGSDTQVQYNNNGVIGADGNLTWNKQSPGTLSVNGNTVFHAGNDGTGSGLDADQLDGLHASSFIRNDTDSTVDGIDLTITDTAGSPSKGILTVRKFISNLVGRFKQTLQVEGGASTEPASGGQLTVSDSSNNPQISFHKNDGTRTGFLQSDTSNTRLLIGHEENNGTLVFRSLSGGSVTDREVVHAGNHTTIVDAEGTAVALAIALG